MQPIEIDISGMPLEEFQGKGKLPLYDSFASAVYLGISPQTLGRYRKERWLKGARIGNGYVYTKYELDMCKHIHANQDKKYQHTQYVRGDNIDN